MRKHLAFLLVAGLSVAADASAQTPKVANAAFEQRSVTGGLQTYFDTLVRAQSKPAWVGYAVPAVGSRHIGCGGDTSWYGSYDRVYLEGRPAPTAGSADAPVKLEGDSTLFVLFRVEGQRAGKLTVFAPDCQLDAGGLRFIWLAGAAPADSVRLLTGLARDGAAGERVARTATMAIALHSDAAADAAL